ncbi:MAG: hypothetical protein CM1200mP9_10890 [Gammaproteobacteria bacterium]|nr:MAG: hypothetical protein CM1200mP9_10890 [Gammaproteobacteria bacterium]
MGMVVFKGGTMTGSSCGVQTGLRSPYRAVWHGWEVDLTFVCHAGYDVELPQASTSI